jgi:2-dehydro-3-deoxygalactonokinase
MRGEEVQVLGAVAAGLAPDDALFCQPGTHNKWIATTGGRVSDIATALTGELFALLRGHGILAGMLDGDVADGAAFRDGLSRGAGARDLTVALFEVRARVLLGRLAPDDAAAFASGVLIGADVGARDDLAGRDVQLLAGGTLADLYAVAIAQAGGRPVTLDSERAFAAGIHRLWELTQ